MIVAENTRTPMAFELALGPAAVFKWELIHMTPVAQILKFFQFVFCHRRDTASLDKSGPAVGIGLIPVLNSPEFMV